MNNKAKPTKIEKSRTCRIEPSANAPTAVFGMMLRMKSTTDSDLAVEA